MIHSLLREALLHLFYNILIFAEDNLVDILFTYYPFTSRHTMWVQPIGGIFSDLECV